jgi:hypothetical protein
LSAIGTNAGVPSRSAGDSRRRPASWMISPRSHDTFMDFAIVVR